jgi:hypothetical protein
MIIIIIIITCNMTVEGSESCISPYIKKRQNGKGIILSANIDGTLK